MPVNTKTLYETLKKDSNYSGIGNTLESFKSYFSKPENANKLYSTLSADKNYEGIGKDINSFTSYFGLKGDNLAILRGDYFNVAKYQGQPKIRPTISNQHTQSPALLNGGQNFDVKQYYTQPESSQSKVANQQRGSGANPIINGVPSTQDVFNIVDKINALKNNPNNSTQIIGGDPFTGGQSVNVQGINKDVQKDIDAQKKLLADAGYDEDLQTDISNIPKNVRSVIDLPKLAQLKKDNPVQYGSAISGVNLQGRLFNDINKNIPDKNEAQQVWQAASTVFNTGGFGSYKQAKESAEKLKDIIYSYSDNRKQDLQDLHKYFLHGFDGNLPDTNEELAKDPRKAYLNETQLLALQKLDITDPEKAASYNILSVKPITPEQKEGYERKAMELDEAGTQQRINGIVSNIKTLTKGVKDVSPEITQLNTIDESMQSLKQKIDADKNDQTKKEDVNNNITEYNNLLAKRNELIRTIQANTLPPDKQTQVEQLQQDYDVATRYAEQFIGKYPNAISMSNAQIAQELAGQEHGGILSTFLKAGRAAGDFIKGTLGTIPISIHDFFAGQNDQSKLYQLQALGDKDVADVATYNVQDNKTQKTFEIKVLPELQKQIDAVKEDKKLSSFERTSKVQDLLNKNPESFDKVPVNPKYNLTAKSIAYASGDMLAQLLPFFASAGIGEAAGVGSKLNTFQAVLTTGINEDYANRVANGSANPGGEALLSTAINGLAFAGVDKIGELKKLAGTKTAVGKLINKMSGDEIEAYLKTPPPALKRFASGLSETTKDAIKASMKLSAAGSAAQTANQIVDGQPIDPKQLAKEFVVGSITQLPVNMLLGGIGNIGKNANKEAIFEAASNPEYYTQAAAKMVEDGKITQAQADNAKAFIDRVGVIHDALPFVNNEGETLSDKDKSKLLISRLKQSYLNNELKKDNPPALQEKNKEELAAEKENEANIYKQKGVTVISPEENKPSELPTVTIGGIKNEPEKKAGISVQLPKEKTGDELPTVTIGGGKQDTENKTGISVKLPDQNRHDLPTITIGNEETQTEIPNGEAVSGSSKGNEFISSNESSDSKKVVGKTSQPADEKTEPTVTPTVLGKEVETQYNERKKSIEDKLNQQLEDNKDRLDDIEDKGGTKTIRQKIYQEYTNDMVELEKWKMKEDLKKEDTPDGRMKKNSDFSANQLTDAIPNSEVHYENKEDYGVTTITLRDKNTKKHIASIDIGTGDTIDGYAGVRIQVNGEHQGKGLSKHLYNLALTEAKKQGLKGLYTIDEMLKTPDKTIATRDNFVTRENTDEKLKTQARKKYTNVADPHITFIENVSDKFIKKGATKLSEKSPTQEVKAEQPTVLGKKVGSGVGGDVERVNTTVFDENNRPVEDDDMANKMIDKAIGKSKSLDDFHSKLTQLGYNLRSQSIESLNKFVQDRIDGKTNLTFEDWRNQNKAVEQSLPTQEESAGKEVGRGGDAEIRNVADKFEEKYNELGNTKEFEKWLIGEDGYGGFLAEGNNREVFNKIPEKWQEQMWEGDFTSVKKRYSKPSEQSLPTQEVKAEGKEVGSGVGGDVNKILDDNEFKTEVASVEKEIENQNLSYYNDTTTLSNAHSTKEKNKIAELFKPLIDKIKEKLGGNTIKLYRGQEEMPNTNNGQFDGSVLSFTTKKEIAERWAQDVSNSVGRSKANVIEVEVPFDNIIGVKTGLGQYEFYVKNEGVVKKAVEQSLPTQEVKAEQPTVSETKQQIKKFGVGKEDIEPVHSVISQVFNSLKNAGLTAAKTVGDWVGIGKGAEKPYSLKINGSDVQVKNVYPEVINGFYSPLEKVITDSKFDKLPAKQWAEKYANSEEAKWTGLADWLNQQQGSVSKADIQQYLKDNRIQVVEVVKGGDVSNAENRLKELGYEIDRDMSGEYVLTKDGEYIDGEDYDNLPSEVKKLSEEIYNKQGESGTNVAKFSQYQTEGEKSNYKEVLVTMPNKNSQEYKIVKGADGKFRIKNPDGAINKDRYWSVRDAAEYALLKDREKAATDFRSTHFDEPNILVHLRMNTRTDAEGKKVLFLEEVQSDWGQKGKKEGFSEKAVTLTPENTKVELSPSGQSYRLMKDGLQYADMSKETGDGFSKQDLHSELIHLANKYGKNEEARKIPTAPFVTDTNAWTKLGLKVALKEAVKQGADKIAWTTGEQQNERYDLSKQVEYIQYEDAFGGTKYVDISTQNSIITLQVDKEGKVLENKNTQLPDVVGKNLSDVIGKDATEKIMRGDGTKERIEPLVVKDDITGKYDVIINGRSVSSGHETYNDARTDYLKNPKYQSTRRLEGEGLKVGGKGMKGFYGSPKEGSLGIVGNVAKSLFKQEPKTVEIETDKNTLLNESYSEEQPDGQYKIWNGETRKWEYDLSKEVAEKRAEKLNEKYVKKNTSTQHSIDITPELKASVEGGQPLFKDAEAQYRIESGKNIVEAIKDFNGSPRATVALTHEIMHPTVVAIIDGAKEGNEVGAKHTETIVNEFNKANPNNKVTTEDLIKGNDAFKDGTTSKQYRAVQEFIAKSWEKYHTEGGKGFSEAFQKVLDQITKAFQSVYKSLTGKQLTPELRKMFDDILGKEQSLPTQEVKAEQPTKTEVKDKVVDSGGGGDVDFTAKGGNKVVNDKGEPLEVYHGTSKSFDELDASKTQRGLFFTSNKKTASSYANTGGDNPRIISAHLNLKNPHIIDAKGKSYDEIMVDLDKVDMATGKGVSKKMSTDEIVEALRGMRSEKIVTNLYGTKTKADGIIIKNVKDALTNNTGDVTDVYIPFSNEQVKNLNPKNKAVEQSLPTQEVKAEQPTKTEVKDKVVDSGGGGDVDFTTQQQSFGGKAFDKAVAKAFDIVADAMDAGEHILDAIEKGYKSLHEYYKATTKSFDENKLRAEFTKQFEDEIKSAKPPTEPPPTPPNDGVQGEGDGNVGMTKAELSKYEAAKKVFDNEKATTWNNIMDKAVSNLIRENPEISVEKAAGNHVNRLAQLYDDGAAINPTAEDLAIIHLSKLFVEQKINSIKNWDSSDVSDRISAMKDLEPLYEQMQKIAKAANPREAGTAFGIRQMLISMGDDGLKIMRMQLMKDKGGNKLSESDMKFTAEQFAKEKELIEQKAEVEKRALQEKFDAELRAQEEKYRKLQEAKLSVEGAAKKAKTRQEKLKESGKEIADKLRSGKISGATADPFLIGKGLNIIIDKLADLVEGGATLAAAIDKYVSDNGLNRKRAAIENAILDHLDRAEKRNAAKQKLDEIINETEATTITKEMTDANVIKDFVDSYVNSVELDKVSDVAFKLLKEKLPDITKEQFKRAYVKEGEFKPASSKDLKNAAALEKRNYAKLTQLERTLGELKKKGDITKNPKTQEAINEKIQKVKDEIDKELLRTGKKKNSNSKLQREADKKIAESHDRNIDNFIDHFNKVVGGDVPKNIKDAVRAVTDDLGAHKIDYKENSTLSQSGKIKKAIDGLDVVNKTMQTVKKDIPKDLYYDMELSLQNMKDVHEKISEDENQSVMLANAKTTAFAKAKEYARKLANNEFDDKPPKRNLSKTDSELTKINIALNAVKSAFDKKKEEYRRANRTPLEVLLETGKSIAVNTLIGLPKTFAKLAWASPAKIMTTYLSKASIGQLNAIVFDRGLRIAAKEGGESSSFESINRGLDAVFKHSNEADLEKQTEINSQKYNKAAENYEQDKTDANKQKMQKALRKSVSDMMYHFIGGKTWDTFVDKLKHRNTVYEVSLGDVNREEWSKVNDWKDVADNISYLFSFVGRSHGALKSISARFHYASSFMARLEGAIERGEDVRDISTLEKISAESLSDWNSGMYQQDNWVTSMGNKVTNWLKDHDNNFAKAVGHGLSWDVAITKVPVNMINEAITEMTFGLPISLIKYAKEVSKAKGIVRAAIPEIKTPEQKAEFKKMLSDELSQLDKKQAAQILRAFRHGGFGLGVMALSTTLLAIQYGGWHHLGETNEDKKKKEGEPKTGEIIVGNKKLNEYLTGCLEHTNALYPTLMYKDMLKNWELNKTKSKKGVENASDVMYKELEHVIETYPQAEIVNPLTMAKEIDRKYSNQAKKAITEYSLGTIEFDDPKTFSKEDLKDPTWAAMSKAGITKPVANASSLDKYTKYVNGKELPIDDKDKKAFRDLYLSKVKKEADNLYKSGHIFVKDGKRKYKDAKDFTSDEWNILMKPKKTKATEEAKEELFPVPDKVEFNKNLDSGLETIYNLK